MKGLSRRNPSARLFRPDSSSILRSPSLPSPAFSLNTPARLFDGQRFRPPLSCPTSSSRPFFASVSKRCISSSTLLLPLSTRRHASTAAVAVHPQAEADATTDRRPALVFDLESDGIIEAGASATVEHQMRLETRSMELGGRAFERSIRDQNGNLRSQDGRVLGATSGPAHQAYMHLLAQKITAVVEEHKKTGDKNSDKDIASCMRLLFPRISLGSSTENILWNLSPQAVGDVAAITFHSVITNHFSQFSLSNEIHTLQSWLQRYDQADSQSDMLGFFNLPFVEIATKIGRAINYRQIDEYLGPGSLADSRGDSPLEAEKQKVRERQLKAGHRTVEQQKILDSNAPGWGLDLGTAEIIQIGMYIMLEVMQPKHGISVDLIRPFLDVKDGGVIEAMPSATPLFEIRHVPAVKSKNAVINPALVELFLRTIKLAQIKTLPMLVPPKAWTASENGGYYCSSRDPGSNGSFVRTQHAYGSTRTSRYEEARKTNKLDDVFDGVNYIASTPWLVNRNVLRIVEAVQQEQIVKDAQDRLEKAKAEPIAKYRRKKLTEKEDPDQLVRPRHEFPIAIAQAFGKQDRTFYLPHSVDYRGRLYSDTPYLHSAGDDLIRSLLLFGIGKPLGKEGLKWLKIHAAGLQGQDKSTLEDREAWSTDNIDFIRAIAQDPFNNRNWVLWTHSDKPEKVDKPWEFLAACFELDDAYSLSDPTAFKSSLPCHQDGTCNGLQYYAALGRDLKGGKSVNLCNSDKPQDVYEEVLAVVKEKLEIDPSHSELRLFFQKFPSLLKRKTVKTTVMTSVYGVTALGATNQVIEAFSSLSRDLDPKPSISQIRDQAKHFANLILASISALFPVASSIQYWLYTVLAICLPKKNNQKSMEWTSPLGLPVSQQYRTPVIKHVSRFDMNINFVDPLAPAPVAMIREKNGFAPNYIHSLDASHLLMTASACKEEDVTYATVHDSFWTHAATTHSLNKLLREEFVRLHQMNVLEELRDELLERYGDVQINTKDIVAIKKEHSLRVEAEENARLAPGEATERDAWQHWGHVALPDGARYVRDVLPPTPDRGKLDIEDVKASRYFFK